MQPLSASIIIQSHVVFCEFNKSTDWFCISEEDAPGKLTKYATEDDSSYHMLDKEEHEARNIRKEKHERGVSMAEYSKFRAKLPFITPWYVLL